MVLYCLQAFRLQKLIFQPFEHAGRAGEKESGYPMNEICGLFPGKDRFGLDPYHRLRKSRK